MALGGRDDIFGHLLLAASRASGAVAGKLPSADRRRRVHEIVEVARDGDRASLVVDQMLVLLIIFNVLAFVLDSVPTLNARYGAWFMAFEVFSVAVFSVEYAARLWSCVELPFLSRMPSWKARLRYAARPYMLIDLMAVLPFYLAFIIPLDLRLLRVLRLFRILKLTRYSPTMDTLLRVIANERRTLTGTLLLLLTVLLFVATAVYYAERAAQPDKFGSIPESAWWAMATLTTVGYGDVTPITTIGKLIGSIAMISGIVVLALPIAVIATGFANEIGKRDFVVTWSVLSGIPAFRGFDADEIGHVVRFLKAEHYDAHREVISPDDPSEAMFFVVSGGVRVKTEGGETLLGPGDFFGELAMLENRQHTNSYRTVRPTRLLRLTREDYLYLADGHPTISARIEGMANARRVARDLGVADPAHGDATQVIPESGTPPTAA